MNPINAGLAGLTAAAIVAAIAYGRAPAPVVAAEPERPSFDLIWHDAAVPTTIKAESLRPRFAAQPEPAPEPVLIFATTNEGAKINMVQKRHKRKHAERSICTRHNMKKVMVGKYRWRCRR